MTATDTSPVSVASYFVNMYFVGCLPGFDLFAGLPDYLEASVESAKPGWSDFKNF